jgi:hypothetical protein
MNDTTTMLVVVVMLFLLLSSSTPATVYPPVYTTEYPPPPAVAPPVPQTIPTSAPSSWLQPLSNIPYLGKAESIAQPVYNITLKPIAATLNKAIAAPINTALGTGACPPTYTFSGHVTGDHGASHTFPLSTTTPDGRCVYDTVPPSGSPQIIVNPNGAKWYQVPQKVGSYIAGKASSAVHDVESWL